VQWADNPKGIKEDVMELKGGSQEFVNFSQAVAEAAIKQLGRPVQ
jgi:hypothetical protein